jgi:excisionase family DNA binding protein
MTSNDYVGIGEAAEILSLSRTSIQKMVDGGQLAAIKTMGGHRRIVRSSLEAFNRQIGSTGGGAMSNPGMAHHQAGIDPASAIQALVVVDDPVLAALLGSIVTQNYPDIRCTIATDGLDAVLQLDRQRPRILITDLGMQPFDGFRLLNLVSSRSEYDALAIVVMSGISEAEIQQKGGLPPNAVFFPKPVNIERLRGFLDAHIQMVRHNNKHPNTTVVQAGTTPLASARTPPA